MMPRPTTLEIELGAAGANVRAVRRLVGPARKIFAVVKADGYGHGAAEMGAAFVENGADALGVADLGEGLRLRRRGITAPILVYPNSLPEAARTTIAHRLTPTLVDLDGARAYSEGRDPAYAEWQLGRFTTVVDELLARGIPVPMRLFAASPFLLKFPQTYLNAVDPGRMLYGITFPGEESPVPLAPTFRALTSRIITLKELAPRERFADKAPFPVTAPMRLGVIPMGSADGLNWLHAGRVLVRGRSVPIVSAPSLEHTRVDLTSVPEAAIGDQVVIIGRQGESEITMAEVAKRHGLGLHHVATTVGPRVTRVYVVDGAPVKTVTPAGEP